MQTTEAGFGQRYPNKNLWKDVGGFGKNRKDWRTGSAGQELGRSWGTVVRNSWVISFGLVFWGDDPKSFLFLGSVIPR